MHDLVMPSEEYSPLQQLVLEPGLLVVRALSELCHADRMPLAMGKNITVNLSTSFGFIKHSFTTSSRLQCINLNTALYCHGSIDPLRTCRQEWNGSMTKWNIEER